MNCREMFIKRIEPIIFLNKLVDNTHIINLIASLKDFNNEKNRKKILKEINKNLSIPLNNNFMTHLTSGGYGYIFKINSEYCIKVNMDNYDYEWTIPNNIYNDTNGSKISWINNFINKPLCFFNNYPIFGLFQYFFYNSMIIKMIDLFNQPNFPVLDFNFYKTFVVNELSKEKVLDMWKANFCNVEDELYEKNIKLFYNFFYKIFNDVPYSLQIIKHYDRFSNLYFKNIKKENIDLLHEIQNHLVNNFTEENKNKILEENNENFLMEFKNQILSNHPKVDIFFGNMSIQNIALGNFFSVYLNVQTKKLVRKRDSPYNMPAYNNAEYVQLFILQTFITIITLHKKFQFMHNDLKPDNVLIFKQNETFIVDLKDITKGNLQNYGFIFKESYIFKLNDFGFSKMKGIENDFIKDTPYDKLTNIYNDIHYLFIHLFTNIEYQKIHPHIFSELRKLINCSKCNKYIKENKKIEIHLVDTKILLQTIENFLETSDLFEKWRFITTPGSALVTTTLIKK